MLAHLIYLLSTLISFIPLVHVVLDVPMCGKPAPQRQEPGLALSSQNVFWELGLNRLQQTVLSARRDSPGRSGRARCTRYAPPAPCLWALLTRLVLCELLWIWPCCITLSDLSRISLRVSLEYQWSACAQACNRHTGREENLQTWSSESWDRSVGRNFRI